MHKFVRFLGHICWIWSPENISLWIEITQYHLVNHWEKISKYQFKRIHWILFEKKKRVKITISHWQSGLNNWLDIFGTQLPSEQLICITSVPSGKLYPSLQVISHWFAVQLRTAFCADGAVMQSWCSHWRPEKPAKHVHVFGLLHWPPFLQGKVQTAKNII